MELQIDSPQVVCKRRKEREQVVEGRRHHRFRFDVHKPASSLIRTCEYLYSITILSHTSPEKLLTREGRTKGVAEHHHFSSAGQNPTDVTPNCCQSLSRHGDVMHGGIMFVNQA